MSAFQKQIQEFNGEEQLQFKQGKGRFNMFAKLSDIIAYIQTKINNSTSIETLSVSFNDRTSSIDNAGSSVTITLFSEPSNTIIGQSIIYTNPTDWGTGINPIFQTSYNTTTLPTGDTTIIIYLTLINLMRGGNTLEYFRTVPIGKGNQIVCIDIDRAL